MPLSVPTKFLSFPETQKYRVLGSSREEKADVRIISATNRDLNREQVKRILQRGLEQCRYKYVNLLPLFNLDSGKETDKHFIDFIRHNRLK